MRTIEDYIGQILGTLEEIETDKPDKKNCIKRICNEILEIHKVEQQEKKNCWLQFKKLLQIEQGRWIPVSERLPDECQKVLVQTEDMYYDSDCISRQAALGCCRNEWEEEVEERLRALPPVTPQPMSGYISIDDVMAVFDDYMRGDADENDTETFLEMLKDKAEGSEEREYG